MSFVLSLSSPVYLLCFALTCLSKQLSCHTCTCMFDTSSYGGSSELWPLGHWQCSLLQIFIESSLRITCMSMPCDVSAQAFPSFAF